MAIKDLQRRQTEVGRLRLGETKDTGRKNKHGEPIMRPVKLETFRFTSPSRALIEQVAETYGGTPAEWHPQGGGAAQWEVYTDARSLPVVVPHNSVSQWYEAWAGGACIRRCDGERELIKDQPCQCSPDPGERQCKPTTRISLMLADVPGIGVWRLESHGYYAATELPAVAELLAAAGGYVPARLELEERSARREKADGSGMETRRWMVPVLHVDAAPAQLLALTGGAARPALTAGEERAALPAGDSYNTERCLRLIGLAKTAAQLNDLMTELRGAGVNDPAVVEAWKARAAAIAAEPAVPATPEPGPDRNEAWMSALGAAADIGWNTADTSARFRATFGHDVTDATAAELQDLRTKIREGVLA